MTTKISLMRREVLEIPAALDRLLTDGAAAIALAAKAAREVDPSFVVTVARGSSDHVCTYLKYATELLLGRPVASIGPSVASLYGARLALQGSLCMAVSQSGQSPDIVSMTAASRRDGALTIALTNVPDSPLGLAADHTLDLHAGPELAVAATKTFVNSAVAGLLFLAYWKGDDNLRAAIHNLPEKLARSVVLDWSELAPALRPHRSLLCLGRGPVWAISNEAALKFKEICQCHAESYSSAEVLHGPVSIVEAGFPVIAFAAGDAAEDALVEVADQIAAKGANVFVTSDRAVTARALPHVRTEHPLTDPIALIATLYGAVEQLALVRGIDPDVPRHLKKVTETR